MHNKEPSRIKAKSLLEAANRTHATNGAIYFLTLAARERNMSVRSFLGKAIRNAIGDASYIRLRQGYKSENSYLRKSHGLIHIGANEGQERDFYACFGLDVLWIEPIPYVFAKLKRNVAGLTKQHALNYLATDEDGKEYEFHVADNGGQSSSIFDLAKHTEMYPEIAYKGAITLRGATLNSILKAENINVRKFDAMVLDTQGSELKILRGAANLLPNFRFIKVEVPDFEAYTGCCQIGELSAFMSSHGFREQNRQLIRHTPGVGTYFEVIYERIRR
jgi:FkbM family methyltransferase